MIYYIDLFCGAGGVSTGVIRAGAKVIACINHDPLAIESHKSNHKGVLHFTEDIKHFNVHILGRLVRKLRTQNPDAKICLWASLECTHFSKAKGGESRDADSRTLAEHLYRYIAEINPDYIDIENVVEFLSWGPLRIKAVKNHPTYTELKWRARKKGESEEEYMKDPYHWVPVSSKKGVDYLQWKNYICDQYNYDYEYKILNAADFGVRTSRVRYFGQFKKRHLPFTWPKQTHAKEPRNKVLGKKHKKWKPVRPCLDLEEKGKSIFGRKKPLSENTMKRIYHGLIKHVGDGKEPEFITKWNSTDKTKGYSNPIDLDGIAPTVTTQNRLGLIQAEEFVMKNYSGKPHQKVKDTNEPLGTITSFGGGGSLVFITQRNSGDPNSKNVSVDGPARTLTQTAGNQDLVFLSKYYGTGITHDIEKPADTLTTKDRISIVWIDKQFSGKSNHQGVEAPAGTILKNDKHAKIDAILINHYSKGGTDTSLKSVAPALTTKPKSTLLSMDPWLVNHNFDNTGKKIEEPSPTLMASRKHYYLVNPQFNNKGQGIDQPCFTLIARMDKRAPSLVETEHVEGFGILVYEDDSEYTVKIKMFMAMYGISDIKMRMLFVNELLKIQGFGSRYKLVGTQTDKKRFIGNSVPPNWVKAMVQARMEPFKYSSALSKVA